MDAGGWLVVGWLSGRLEEDGRMSCTLELKELGGFASVLHCICALKLECLRSALRFSATGLLAGLAG